MSKAVTNDRGARYGKRPPERQRSAPNPSAPPTSADGLLARDVAVSALFSVLVEKRPFDDVFAKAAAARNLAPRDRAFARLIATTVLRNRGSLQAVLRTYLEKTLPEHLGRLEQILLAAAAQLLLIKTPPHAAISL
ncbi:MAG: MFS transporter, partial [Hyphomicrobium denitrificans]|nr:MFS transporter [Hyphomicrobium denitrificans]